ncbi:MAG TPA: hypothetical protein D7I05_03685 [Candidatus Poseidoniales archaeon]|nr:MAG TPA: hypothetical protein D7I05_03685 [Candidatus Poseidoniales archaeon]|tara:strand:+ start:765 stop:1337 length:573 start_codon:yes stop_codon:yes gene_type:complete
MSLPDDQLRRLLDGEIDAGELAGDRVMASIADRVFGVKVDPAVRPVKPRDADTMGQPQAGSSSAEPELLVEIIPGGVAPLPNIDAPPPSAPIPALETPPAIKRRRKGLILIGMLGLAAALVNVFMGLGEFIPTCAPSVHVTCGESLKLNWLDAYRTAEHVAWGETGIWGIPDMVATGVSALLFLFGFRKR